MKVWASYEDARRSVETIRKMINATEKLPEFYVAAINDTLQKSRKGVVQHFFETLTEKCPEALRYFSLM